MFQELVHKADLGNGYYQNPILDGDYADPAVFREGENYYLTASTGPYYPGLSIYWSKDLVNWKLICHPLRKFEGEVWAPDILKYKDRYYIYFCGQGTNWVIWSEKIDGAWSDAIDLKIGHIDPGHVTDEKGKRYLLLSENSMVPLSEDGLQTAGEMRQLFEAPEISDQWDIEGAFPEAPNIFKKDGFYYLTYADGGTSGPATSHMIMCARARSLTGPWEVSPYNPVVHTWNRNEKWQSKGHGHFVEDLAGNWWVIYHAYEKGYAAHGRKLLLSPVEFMEDGWPLVTQRADEASKKPAGEKITDTSCFSDDFSEEKITGWRAWGKFDPANYRRGEDGLKMQATGADIFASNPFTLITGDHSYEASVYVCPEAECEAGLILQYNSRIYNGVGLKNGILTIYRLGCVLAVKEIGAEECWLKMRNDEQYLCFFYSLDGMHYKKLNYVINTESQNTHAYNGFLSLRPGLFAAGKNFALFQNFVYRGLK